jgi:hypothetical protein
MSQLLEKAIEKIKTLPDDEQDAITAVKPTAIALIILKEIEEDSTKTIVEGLEEGWKQALSGKTRPVSQLWDCVDENDTLL